MASPSIQALIGMLARLPGMGPRSARRIAMHLLRHREQLFAPLLAQCHTVLDTCRTCSVCGNLDDTDPCGICQDTRRDPHSLCVVEEVADAWALERTGLVQGRYHILGGVLSALDGRTPDMLRLESLYHRVAHHRIAEVIVATNGTVEGQATAHYIVTLLRPLAVRVTRPAYGIPVGGELEYLDDGTLDAAFRARKLQET